LITYHATHIYITIQIYRSYACQAAGSVINQILAEKKCDWNVSLTKGASSNKAIEALLRIQLNSNGFSENDATKAIEAK
jgi:hypothetical protein